MQILNDFKLHFDIPNMIISVASVILTLGIVKVIIGHTIRIYSTTIEENGLTFKSFFWIFPWAI